MSARILITDDSADNRELMQLALEDEGYELHEAANGEEALATAQAIGPDLILLDVVMPTMDGIECCRRLKEDERTRKVPVLLVTSLDNETNVVRGLNAGATDFISKPFGAPVIRARIRSALRAKAAQDALEDAARQNRELAAELVRRNRELADAVHHDGLTGLPNRVLLMDRLEQAIRRTRREPSYKFAVLYLDFDRFKLVNDTLGHEVGDQLLVSIADRLRAELRGVDLLSVSSGEHVPSRLGGDEFVILLDGIKSYDDAAHVGTRLQEILAVPYSLGGHELVSSASIGIVTSDRGYDRAEQILRDADTAMYHAKRCGKARQAIFNQEMHDESLRRIRMEEALTAAIERDELTVHYQPIYRLESGVLEGVEAVVRWAHPEHGLLDSTEFMDIADRSGLILPLGEKVLVEACKALRAWRDRFGDRAPRHVTVNLWEQQLLQPDIVVTITRALQRVGLEPGDLILDVPEQVFVRGTAQALHAVEELRDRGVIISMDGCGKGDSALTSLHRMPIDMMKVDPTFTTNMTNRVEYAAIFEAVITLAHNLSVGVVAVGIETAAQLAQLQSLECDWGQGRHLAAPLSTAAFEGLLEDGDRRMKSA